MGTSKLTNENFSIHYRLDMVEFRSKNAVVRSLIESDESYNIISMIIEENKTTILRKLLQLMKEEALIDEFELKRHGLHRILNKICNLT